MQNQIIIGKRANSNFIRKLGTLINLEEGLFKLYDNVLGIPSGSWKKIPKFEYVLLFKTLYIKCEGCSPEDFESDNGAVYQLSLVYNKNRKLIVHESKIKQEVFLMAEQLSHYYKIKIKDAASDRRHPVWKSPTIV